MAYPEDDFFDMDSWNIKSPEIDIDRMTFILKYIVAARRSGRTQDFEGDYYNEHIVNIANSLYDEAKRVCLIKGKR